jgi:hypothetical protein
MEVATDAAPALPATLTLDEAFRATFYMARAYLRQGGGREQEVFLFCQYLWSDPARWDDWQCAIREALTDGGAAGPQAELGGLQRPDWTI